jgi:hypothetical protein
MFKIAAEYAAKSVVPADADFDSATDEKLFSPAAIVKTNAVGVSENQRIRTIFRFALTISRTNRF